MADTANSTPASDENPAVFNPAAWLSQFEAIGGGFLATESQTSLCIACQGNTPENQSAAHAMLRELTDDQRAAVIAHIRARAGLSAPQSVLNAISLEKLSDPAGTSVAPSGPTLGQPEGSQDMDTTHSFTLPRDTERPADWNAALAEYEAARAWSDSLPEGHAQEDAAVDAYCDAMDHLVKGVRATSPEALSRKIELSKGRWESIAIPDEWLNAFQADLAAWGQARHEPVASRIEWNATMEAYDAAREAETRYRRDVFTPADESDDPAPDHVDEEMTRLACQTDNEIYKVIDTPAPDADALRWKLKTLLCGDTDGINRIRGQVDWDSVSADLDRLLDSPQFESGASASSAYFAELDALDALGSKLDHLPSGESDRWDKWSMRLWGEIEALPVTPENASLKARAVWSIMGGELEELGDDTTCCRLIRQIIAAMAPAVAIVSSRAEWDAAMARYHDAERKMVADKSDEACDAFVDAEYYAMDLPSPDLQALRWKIERLREDAKYSRISPPSFDRLIGDITRLIGEA
ncbi:MAG: hypothetical protein KGJ57_04965 [Sphingomonadales bacterium]|nr:hypothetical protein [Sphingomonadales bacterium]MDE2168767.1 hypothetical protein [Sphingomonadales bacterium]